MKSALRAGAAGFVALLLGGCMVGPKYERPEPLPGGRLPEAFNEAETLGNSSATNAALWKSAEPSAHLSRGSWWSVFGDAELNRLEGLATEQNQELAGSLARLEQARALVTVARSDLFPHFNFSPSFNRQRTSANSFDRGQAAGVSHSYNTLFVGADAEWELDLWGRVRQQVSAARARLTASEDDLEAARLSIQAEVATDYFSLVALESEYALIQKTIESFRRSFDLTVNRRKGGIASDLDVSQAETQLKATEALLPAIELERARVLNALAMLCGETTAQFKVQIPAGFQLLPQAVTALPSELLERRPDVAAAERRMAAANADVGVAKTAFYPRVTFHGLAGLQSIDAGSVFNWPSRVWAFGPTLQLPLFTGGRNRAELAFSRAGYRGTVADYRQSVLVAFREVEDQLAAQRLLTEQFGAEQAALNSARRTLEIAENRYKAGLVTYLEVATAQSAALDRERSLVRLSSERLTAQVALIKALGGGWERPDVASR